jgi:hypothetical protein
MKRGSTGAALGLKDCRNTFGLNAVLVSLCFVAINCAGASGESTASGKQPAIASSSPMEIIADADSAFHVIGSGLMITIRGRRRHSDRYQEFLRFNDGIIFYERANSAGFSTDSHQVLAAIFQNEKFIENKLSLRTADIKRSTNANGIVVYALTSSATLSCIAFQQDLGEPQRMPSGRTAYREYISGYNCRPTDPDHLERDTLDLVGRLRLVEGHVPRFEPVQTLRY